jgi:putative MATE family efflux protein
MKRIYFKSAFSIANIIQIRQWGIKKLLSHLSEALKGSERDYTNVGLGRSIFLLAVPMVLEMLMESLFAIVDIFFVSRLGSDAVATVGLTESMMTIIYAIGFGLSAGATAIISRRIGEKNYESASKAAVQAIITGIFVSLLLAIPGLFFSKDLLRLMGASEQLINKNHMFTTILLSGNIVILLLFIINAAFRSAGDAAIAMRVLWYANLLNMILDPCLIFGLGPFPELGIKGAAIATTTGRGLAVGYQLYLMFSGKRMIKLVWAHITLNLGILGSIIRLSIGGTLQNLIATTSWVFMVRILSHFGNDVVAGYTIAIRILIFSLLPSWGLSNAASTLVGQNLGAGKPIRAERVVRITSIVNMIVMGVAGFCLIVFANTYIGLFTTDTKVMAKGTECLRLISYGCVFYGLGMVMTQCLNGAGETYTPTYINLFCFWMLEIPLSYFLAIDYGLAENGVYIAILTAETMLSLIGFFVVRKGNWKIKKV